MKPAVDVALPVLQSAGEEALKIASPVVSDASRQAKEALQSAGVDPSPVLSAATVFPCSFLFCSPLECLLNHFFDPFVCTLARNFSYFFSN